MKIDTSKKYDLSIKPLPSKALLSLEWVIATCMAPPWKAKIKKVNCEDLKAPYLMLATHASLKDFPMAVLAMFPHRSYWLVSIEEFIGKEKLMRTAGCIAKRKFTLQLPIVKHTMVALTKDKINMSIYPEARYSIAGINERLDGALGKLVKKCKVPVVMFMQHGNFLNSPQWCKYPTRRIVSTGEYRQLVTREEVETLTAEEIQKRIEEAFVYDEYAWQRDNKIKVKSKYRAHNIHRILYQCPCCKKEFRMNSEYTRLWCEECNASWEMDIYGQLHRTDGGEEIFTHVPDWYRWERANVTEEVRSGNYHFEDEVRVEKIINSKVGFQEIGKGYLTHDYNGFTVTGTMYDGTEFYLNRSPQTMISCHIEYNFKKRGDALDLATQEDSYWVYPINAKNPLTKFHFATEVLYDMSEEKFESKI